MDNLEEFTVFKLILQKGHPSINLGSINLYIPLCYSFAVLGIRRFRSVVRKQLRTSQIANFL